MAILALLASGGLVLAVDYPWGDMVAHAHWTNVGWIPFMSWPVRALDIAGNLLLCAPLGASAGAIFNRGPAAAAGLALAVSIGGETMQVYSHTRFPSATDVVCNVAGAVAAAFAVAWSLQRRGERL